ncbi:FecR domain-containing protein [Achromobacter deleyi]|uniref:FecR domain-containing protein n=1 Tax=Achromobacter deleyi TaxID=1353891 RepID=UPI0014662A9B|nr:FecR domain-containing protein [Achromobacter deleyi]CAB3920598.1 Protein FecR [Achromobacter deleyi]
MPADRGRRLVRAAPLSAAPDRRVLQAAADWFARLGDERASADDTRQWQAWLAATPEHRRAWDAVTAISARFEAVAGPPALDALTHAGQGRRRALRTLMLLAGAGGLGAAAWTQPATRRQWADLRTDVGQTRQATLEDGSRLWLNTASAVNLRFDDTARRVVLVDGETLIDTHPDARTPARPFLVDVGYAQLQALGTRFSVLRDGGRAWLDVYAGAVQIQPADAASRIVPAGTRTAFSGRAIDAPQPLDSARDAWTRGELVADGMPLGRFAAELARYRRGFVTCTPDIAQLPLVGVFPLADTDRILRALESTLPVRAHRVLPGWIRLEAA